MPDTSSCNTENSTINIVCSKIEIVALVPPPKNCSHNLGKLGSKKLFQNVTFTVPVEKVYDVTISNIIHNVILIPFK